MTSIALFPLKLLLLSIDFAITIVTFGWVKPLLSIFKAKPLRSVPVANDPSHRVNAAFKGNIITGVQGGQKTLYEVSMNAFKTFASQNCMATREYLGLKKDEVQGKDYNTFDSENQKKKSTTPPVKVFGSTLYKTFAEVESDVHKFGAALREAGLVAAPKTATLDAITTPCSLAIFENTSAEWMIAAQGAFSQSIIVTTIYATLGMDAVVDAVQDCVISAIVCNKKDVANIVDRSYDIPTIKTIIYTSDAVAKDEEILMPVEPSGVTIISFEEFVAAGDIIKFPPTPPAPETTAVIMYTSGSTGKPKGVVISHEQIVAAIGSGNYAIGMTSDDVYLAYLPLAHIMELMAEFCALGAGCLLCYADPKTLTAKGAYPIGALEQYSPTLMAGVPKIWDVIKKGVEAKIAAMSPLKRFLIATAFEARTFAINKGFDTPLFKALVFNKFSAVVGGKLRVALTGGGPCNAEVQSFIRTCFGCPMFQGYGLTETCALLTIQDLEDLRPGIAGVPTPSVEIKLRSVPEINDKAGMPYLNTDTRDVNGNRIFGRGEILAKGMSVALGYYRMPKKTTEVFREDGFFSTGDIGQFMDDGSIRIVDRVKNLVKLKGGEYIAIENMEITYGNSSFVDAIAGGICCYGDGDMDRPVALIQLNEAVAMNWAKENGVSGDFETVKKSKELNDAVLKDMHNEGKKGGLSRLEKLVALTFLDEPWTPGNGCLTPANKLQRRAIVEMFKNEFDAVKEKGIF